MTNPIPAILALAVVLAGAVWAERFAHVWNERADNVLRGLVAYGDEIAQRLAARAETYMKLRYPGVQREEEA